MIPESAVFEACLSGEVAIYDVSHLLPLNKKRRFRRRHIERPSDIINRVFVHHSGALGRAAFRGLLNSVRYAIRDKKLKGGRVIKGMPACPYHFWIPWDSLRDDEGRLVVFRCHPDEYRAWHTGAKANDDGIGLAIQGNTSKRPLTEDVEIKLDAMLHWLIARHQLDLPDGVSFHAEAKRWGARKNKPACPGTHAEAFVRGWRRVEHAELVA